MYVTADTPAEPGYPPGQMEENDVSGAKGIKGWYDGIRQNRTKYGWEIEGFWMFHDGL